MRNFWKNKRVFVTGATGLVGSWLVRALLERKAKVITLVFKPDKKTYSVSRKIIAQTTKVEGSLENYSCLEKILKRHKPDTVFHLGAQPLVTEAVKKPLSTFETDIRGTYHLLEACRHHPKIVKRIVVASSDKAYGQGPTLPYNEKMPLNAKYPYDVSKACADMLAQSYWHTYQLPVVVARCGNIFGGGDLHWDRIVPSTIKSFHYGRCPKLRSDGTFVRDYIYVEDAVSAYLLMGESLSSKKVKGEVFNFGPNKPRTILELVSIIQSLMKRKDLNPLILNAVKHEIHDQYLSSSKAKRLLGWKPKFSLENGLKKTIDWYQNAFRTRSYGA